MKTNLILSLLLLFVCSSKAQQLTLSFEICNPEIKALAPHLFQLEEIEMEGNDYWKNWEVTNDSLTSTEPLVVVVDSLQKGTYNLCYWPIQDIDETCLEYKVKRDTNTLHVCLDERVKASILETPFYNHLDAINEGDTLYLLLMTNAGRAPSFYKFSFYKNEEVLVMQGMTVIRRMTEYDPKYFSPRKFFYYKPIVSDYQPFSDKAIALTPKDIADLKVMEKKWRLSNGYFISTGYIVIQTYYSFNDDFNTYRFERDNKSPFYGALVHWFALK